MIWIEIGIERDISAALSSVKFHENPSGGSRPDSADRLTCQRSQWFCERGQLCGACTADMTMQRCSVLVLCVRCDVAEGYAKQMFGAGRRASFYCTVRPLFPVVELWKFRRHNGENSGLKRAAKFSFLFWC